MTAMDTATAVLAKASLLDHSIGRPDHGVALAWAEVLGDVDRRDALQAVAEHYRTSDRRLMPRDVLVAVKRIRAVRIAEAGVEAFEPPDVDPEDVPRYLAAVKARRAAIGSGDVDAQPPAGSRRPVRELLESTPLGGPV